MSQRKSRRRRHRRQFADQGRQASDGRGSIPGRQRDDLPHRRHDRGRAGTWPSATATGRRSALSCAAPRSPHKVEGMHEVPLDVCGADSQGAIGYALQQTLQNELFQRRHQEERRHRHHPGAGGSQRPGLPESHQAHRRVHGRSRSQAARGRDGLDRGRRRRARLAARGRLAAAQGSRRAGHGQGADQCRHRRDHRGRRRHPGD